MPPPPAPPRSGGRIAAARFPQLMPSGFRVGDSDATHVAVVFSLKAKIEVAGTDESPLEIGEPEKGRQGQAARDGGLRRTETGQNCREQC